MTAPHLIASSDDLYDVDVDVLAVAVAATAEGPRLLSDDARFDDVDLDAIGLTGAADEVRRVPFSGRARSLALVGVGSTTEPGANELRYAAGSATRQLVGIDSIAFAFPIADDAAAQAIAEGAAIGAWAFTPFRSAPLARTKTPATEVLVLGATDAALTRASIVAEATHRVRDLVTTPASHLYPETFADAALAAAEGTDVEVTVYDVPALEAGGFGGILAVGAGSTRPPRLVKVSYSPEGATKHLALVGKGITFDTGGLQLKPPTGMVGMKYDMTGAATVLAVTLAASALALPVRVTAWLCVAENMPSGSAMRPGDVFTIRNGTTVENLNSDAEGRLVLADGLSAASEEQPDAIVDVATLTGAARVALGNRYIGLMGDAELGKRITRLGEEVGELFWAMPLPGEVRALINSDVADLANARPGNTAAGMLLAGTFLAEFVGDAPDGTRIPWAHLDIAGPANNDGGGFGFTGKGSTAITVRTLIALAEHLARK